jgi:3',5'-cyclic AMP phosphodiesterase CpdA
VKRKTKRILSLFLVAAMSLIFLVPAFAAVAKIDVTQPSDIQLQFNEDGKFKIIQFADCQDTALYAPAMVAFIERALETYQPDLVVFTGDNVVQPVPPLNKMAIEAIIDPVAKAGVPFAFTFGNHDAETISKETMFQHYRSYSNCITYDPVPSLTGMGTSNNTILSSDGSRIAFNLWMIDSGMRAKEDDGYDYVHQDQIDWYKSTSEALELEAGGKVPSLMFQHIPVPEIYEVYLEAAPGDSPTKVYNGKTLALKLNPAMATGYLGEWSCPPNINSGQFAALVERGDVLGIVTGHDHVNSFVGTYQGIDFIQTPGITFSSYGDDKVRGARLITLDENDPWSYETETFTYFDLFTDAEYYGLMLKRIPTTMLQFAKAFLYLLQYIFSFYPA